MVEDAARTPLKAMVTTPSCVPAVPGFEDTGSSVGPEDDRGRPWTWPSVVGLGEMMNFPGILAGTDHAHGEVAATLEAGKIVTGHYSMPETDQGLNAYVASGVRCCHESTRAEDALAKMRLGMYAQLRYGSAWKDLPVLAEAVLARPTSTRASRTLVSDDTHPHTLVADGHLDHIVRTAVELGIDAVHRHPDGHHQLRPVLPDGPRAGLHRAGQVRRHRVLGRPGGPAGHPRAHRRRRGGRKRPRACSTCRRSNSPTWVTHSMHLGRETAPDTVRACPRPLAPPTATPCACARSRSSPARCGTFEAHVDLPVADGRLGVRPSNRTC